MGSEYLMGILCGYVRYTAKNYELLQVIVVNRMQQCCWGNNVVGATMFPVFNSIEQYC